MSTLNKTGLRAAAAGAAAALTLAVGAPAFAQTESPSTEAAETPVAENTETPVTENETETPAPETTEDAPAEEVPGGDSEVAEEKDPALEEVPEGEVPAGELPAAGEDDEEEFGSSYSYMYIDEVLQGADVGESVEAHPEFYIDAAAENPEDIAATVLVFNDSVSLESVDAGAEWELTNHAWAWAPYDNCNVWEWGTTCVVTDFEGEADTTYGIDAPLYFDIVDEVDDNDIAPYYAVDVDAATLEEVLAEGYYDFETDNQLGLTETEPTEGDWYFGFGAFYFEAGQGLPNVPTAPAPGGGGQLPTTGNSSIILVSSAAAAVLAGAVVFFMLRRRKTATNWE